MARPHIHEDVSAYYPPRARWYSGILYLFEAICRFLRLDRLSIAVGWPAEMRVWKLLAGAAIPGLGVWFRGPRWAGWLALGAAMLLPLIFIAALGFLVGNLAFGILVSLHVTGLVYYCEPLLVRQTLVKRLVFTLLVLWVMGFYVYLPIRNYVQENWFMPLIIRDQVLVIHPTNNFKAVHRGDWVAYELHEADAVDTVHDIRVWTAGGMGFGPVLAVPGDEVTFTDGTFAVNGVVRPARPHMPATGGFTVPENEWFIWQDFVISDGRIASESVISSTIMNQAHVQQAQYRGKPFHRWFGRKQDLP